MLALTMPRQLRVSKFMSDLLDVQTEHRPTLGQINHPSVKLAQGNPVIARIVGPELGLLTDKCDDLCRDLHAGLSLPSQMRRTFCFTQSLARERSHSADSA